MEKLKKEFEDTFTGGKKFAGSLNLEEVWDWFEQKLKAIQVEAKVKPANGGQEELKYIAQRLSAIAGMPYCWEDILDRLNHGYQLPFKFEDK